MKNCELTYNVTFIPKPQLKSGGVVRNSIISRNLIKRNLWTSHAKALQCFINLFVEELRTFELTYLQSCYLDFVQNHAPTIAVPLCTARHFSINILKILVISMKTPNINTGAITKRCLIYREQTLRATLEFEWAENYWGDINRFRAPSLEIFRFSAILESPRLKTRQPITALFKHQSNEAKHFLFQF